MELLQRNLHGAASATATLRALPALAVFSYQCSPLSTGRGIESVFQQARAYKQTATDTVVVVLLDEVRMSTTTICGCVVLLLLSVA
jgi:hypothetical protein